MAKRKYPRSAAIEQDQLLKNYESAFISWDGDSNQQAKAFAAYTKTIQESSIASQRDFRSLDGNMGSGPGLTNSDFDWYRPSQAAPKKHKDIIAYARYAYRRIGLIHNSMDLMGDFSCQGIRLTHKNKSVEAFYNSWFKQVQGKRVSERLGHLLFREANCPIRFYTAKIKQSKRKEMQASVGSADIEILDKVIYGRKEIPWRYCFIDPILTEPVSGPLSTLSGHPLLELRLPENLKQVIKKLKEKKKTNPKLAPVIDKILSDIPPDVIEAANSSNNVLLDPDKTRIYYYKKDDWQPWADPLVFSAFDDLNLYQRMKLADKAALDGAINKIRVWKIGSLEHKLAPSPVASSTLSDMLGANVGGGTKDIIWGPDIELIETDSNVEKFLGEAKYQPTLMAIYAALGIPPTLTGTFGASGTTNNFIGLKTLVERLNYVRDIISSFWEEQIEIVQKAMGFRTPAIIEYDTLHLDDPSSMITLMTALADRNILSDEFIQRQVKATPSIESKRIAREHKDRQKNNMEKISPYHQVDQDHNLEKIALQTGLSTPSEVGLELQEKKEGEKSLYELKAEEMKNKMSGQPNTPKPSGSPGRPFNSNDKVKRKTKQFKPKTKAFMEIWAKDAQEKIDKVIDPIMLKHFDKPNKRSLTSAQANKLEKLKFEILCNLSIDTELNEKSIAYASQGRSSISFIHDEFDSWVKESEEILGKLTLKQIRDMKSSYYAYLHTKE